MSRRVASVAFAILLASGSAASALDLGGGGSSPGGNRDSGGIGRTIGSTLDRTADGLVDGGRTATRAVGSVVEETGSFLSRIGRNLAPPPQAVPSPQTLPPSSFDPAAPPFVILLPETPPPLPQPRPDLDAVEIAAIDPARPEEAIPDLLQPDPESPPLADAATLNDLLGATAAETAEPKSEAESPATTRREPAPEPSSFAALPEEQAAADPAAKAARVVYQSSATPAIRLASLDAPGQKIVLRSPDDESRGMNWAWLGLAALALAGIHFLRCNQGATTTSVATILARFRPRAG